VPDDVRDAENEQTGWNGGFSCVLGNPPWERLKIQEKEWFAECSPEIANAANAAARKRMIEALIDRDPYLLADFRADQRRAEGESHFVRISERYRLTSVGDVNTYALFAGLSRELITSRGLAGIVIPTGVATDDQLSSFFDELIKTETLKTLIGFENEEFIFPGIANVIRFCIFVILGTKRTSDKPIFAFYLRRLSQIEEKDRFFEITAEEIALLNPNTLTSPIFRNRVDAELTKAIYQRIPILENESASRNMWGASFLRMFDMANDSNLFLEAPLPDTLPLYEAKFFWHYDHRFGGYDLTGKSKGGRGLPYQTASNYGNPHYSISPRYWVRKEYIDERLSTKWDQEWLIAYRKTANSKVERTVTFSVIPRCAVNDKAPLLLTNHDLFERLPCLLGNLNAIVLDFIARQKVGGTDVSYFHLKQLPILPPDSYMEQDIEFIVPRVLELVYTAWDVQAFAQDMGYQGDPFVWNEERRSILRSELDAYYAKLYGLTRDELRYVLDPTDIYGESFPGETFRVLKEKEIGLYGEYRTKRLVLEAWDRLFGDE